MAILPSASSTQASLVGATKSRADQSSVKEAGAQSASVLSGSEAAVFERSSDSQNLKLSHSIQLGELKRQAEEKYASLRIVVENLFSKQTMKSGKSEGLSFEQIMERYNGNLKSFYENLEVDDSTRLEAQQAISEDGFFGVKQTSDRMVQFAIAVSGGDPSKLAELKGAIEKGYAEAEKAWGGKLPDICQKTREATMQKLDDWASSLK